MKPVIFRGVDLGPCVERWCDPEYLKEAEGGTVASVHVSHNKGGHMLDFVRKNFAFKHVPFPELVAEGVTHYKAHRAMPLDKETWYFHSVAVNMRTERADLWRDFSGLGCDFALPPGAGSL